MRSGMDAPRRVTYGQSVATNLAVLVDIALFSVAFAFEGGLDECGDGDVADSAGTQSDMS
jgi:hypothetical protein